MQKVGLILKTIRLPNQHIINNNDSINVKENDFLQESLNINGELLLDNISNIINGANLQSQTYIMNTKNNSSSASIQTKDSFNSTFNDVIVDKFITIIIKKHDRGYTFDQIQLFIINQKILSSNQITNDLI